MAPAAGETSDVVIEELGLTIELNSSFSTSTDISANNSFQVSGSASNQVDLALRIGTSIGAVDEISICSAFVWPPWRQICSMTIC